MAREPRGDFDSGELELLGRVYARDKLHTSLIGLIALTFFFNPFGTGGEERVINYVSTEKATSWLAGDGVGGVSLLTPFDVVAIAFGPLSNLFMVEEPPRVLTIFLV